MVLTLQDRGKWTGTLRQPEHWSTIDGITFSAVGPGVVERSITRISLEDPRLRFVVENPKDPASSNEYEMTLIGANDAAITIVGAPFDPWRFTRTPNGAPPAVPASWNPQAFYSRDEQRSSSAEMQSLYDRDQLARQDFEQLTGPQKAALEKQDKERRDRTRTLLDRADLHTAQDFRQAAFLFQHGNTPEDFLLGHSLP